MSGLRTAAQQALEALKMMRDQYEEYACPACDHADAAIYALKEALVEDAMQKFTDVNQELMAALGCEHCNQPLYAAIKCRVCGRVTEPAPPAQGSRRHGEDAGGVTQTTCKGEEMNKEDVIKLMLQTEPEMAIRIKDHEEGLEGFTGEDPKLINFWPFENYVKFAALVAAAERERNAQIADAHASIEGIAQLIAAEIRGQA